MRKESIKYSLVLLLSLGLLLSCGKKEKEGLKNGKWRGEFTLSEHKTVPFIFEAENTGTDSAVVYLINGAERVPLKGIYWAGDTVIVPIESYDAELRGTVSNGKWEGIFKKLYLENDPGLPFNAVFADAPRFEIPTNPTDVSPTGRWEILFIGAEGDTSKNVGVFAQEGEIITGSVLTKTGDLRYLEGSLTSNGFQLSGFSGLSPYLFEFRFAGKDEFTGEFYTQRGITRLEGKRNDNASLSDPYSMTSLKEGYDRIEFAFPDPDGNLISLSDPEYRDKVVVVSILGSWCPNCLDEMEYLSPWYKENKDRGVEIIGLAFERKDDPQYVKTVLSRLIKRYDVTYKILFAGKTGAESTATALPAIDKVMSYPTTVFIDKNGLVRKIHTGFNGPATGLFYEEFKKEFNSTIDKLLAE